MLIDHGFDQSLMRTYTYWI